MKGVICLLVLLLLPLSWPATWSSASEADSSLPITGVVQHLVLPSKGSKTSITIIVGGAFTGTLPGAIDEIIVESPMGICPLVLKDFKYMAENREFWAVCSRPPIKGEYHITVCSGDLIGNVSTVFTGVQKMSPPKSLKCESDKDGLVSVNRPVFSWETDPESNHLYYQLQIKKSSGKMIYKSGFLEDAAAHIPLLNLLEPGRDYFYRVRVFDRPDWASVQNRGQSDWIPFKTAATMEYGYRPPDATDNGWETGHIDATGLNPAPLKRMLTGIINKNVENIHSILLVKDGKLILEEYFDGYYRDRLQLVASVTKSVNSLLFGILVDRGLITDLDQSAWDYFPEYGHPADLEAKRKITLRHLLTMTAGLDWDYLSVPVESSEYDTNRMINSGDPIGFIMARKVVAPPGQIFNYCDGLALMLGEIIHRVSGLTVIDFAKANLFDPLGIQDFVWFTSENGVVHTQGGLNLRPRDMAKIGQLVLQDGQWKNSRIVSKAWLRESTRAHVQGDGKGYGYQWRQAYLERAAGTFNIMWASGYGGQRIYIVPALNLVAVITSKVLYHREGGMQAEKLFVSHMLSAVLPQAKTDGLPVYTGIKSEKLLGCYQAEALDAYGCVVKDGDELQLCLTVRNKEEKCRIKPISGSVFLGQSPQLGEFSIVLHWTEAGELEYADFKTGLVGVVMRPVK